jgi:hypothetical protein
MHIRHRKGQHTVIIKKKGFVTQYKTFSKKSDTLRFGKQVEAQMQLKQFKDVSKATKTLAETNFLCYINSPDN